MNPIEHLVTRRLGFAAAFLLALIALQVRPAAAQSIGIEGGITTVETFDGVRPTVGISLFLPLTERLRLAASGTQWSGCPDEGCDDPREGYGNRGLNLIGLFTVLDGRQAELSLGAGMGWYEVHRADGNASDTGYDETLTFAAELRREVAFNSGMYLRGETSFPIDDGDARWMSLRLGVDIRVF